MKPHAMYRFELRAKRKPSEQLLPPGRQSPRNKEFFIEDNSFLKKSRSGGGRLSYLLSYKL